MELHMTNSKPDLNRFRNYFTEYMNLCHEGHNHGSLYRTRQNVPLSAITYDGTSPKSLRGLTFINTNTDFDYSGVHIGRIDEN